MPSAVARVEGWPSSASPTASSQCGDGRDQHPCEDRDTSGRNPRPPAHHCMSTLSAMRVLVTGGAGFIGSHFAKRLAAAGEDVVVLDKLTYSGNRANLEGADVEFFEGDIGDPEAVAEAADRRAGDRQLRRRDARRPLDPRRRRVHRDRRPRHVGAARFRPRRRRPARPGLDRRGLRRRPPKASARAPRTTRCARRARTPRRRPAATCRCSPPCAPSGSTRCITRGANTYGPNQYPEKLIPLFVTNALDGEALPVYGDGRQRREWLHVGDHCGAVELVLREGRAGEVYNVGGEEHENIEITNRILELTGAAATLVRHVDDRPGHDRRYSLDDSKLRGLGWSPQHSFDGRAGGDGRVVSREPRLVGADQVRRVPRVLQAEYAERLGR